MYVSGRNFDIDESTFGFEALWTGSLLRFVVYLNKRRKYYRYAVTVADQKWVWVPYLVWDSSCIDWSHLCFRQLSILSVWMGTFELGFFFQAYFFVFVHLIDEEEKFAGQTWYVLHCILVFKFFLRFYQQKYFFIS